MESGFRLKTLKELFCNTYYTGIISALDQMTTVYAPPKIIHVRRKSKGPEIDP